MNGKKVLIMDDEQAICKSTSKLIEMLGNKAEYCFNGMDAIKLHKEAFENNEPFDIVILDIHVSNGLGATECIDSIRKTDSNVHIIISSGDLNSDHIINYKDYGFDGVLCKPFRIDDLKEILK